MPSTARSLVRTSSIGVLQFLPEALLRAVDVHADRRGRRADDSGDLSMGVARVVVERDGCALMRSKPAETPDQVDDRFQFLVAVPSASGTLIP